MDSLIPLNSPAGIISLLAGLLSFLGVIIAAIMITVKRNQQDKRL